MPAYSPKYPRWCGPWNAHASTEMGDPYTCTLMWAAQTGDDPTRVGRMDPYQDEHALVMQSVNELKLGLWADVVSDIYVVINRNDK